MSGRWTPGIGDPSALGWITVVAYLAAAAMCGLAARADPTDRGAARFWRAVALLMLLLGINKQLDLQTLLTQIGRAVALRYGWYEQRRALQAAFILMVAVGSAIAIGMLWQRAAALQRNIRYAQAGVIFVTTYVVIRAASFHHADIFISARLFGMRRNWIIELSGLAVIIVAAMRAGRSGAGRR